MEVSAKRSWDICVGHMWNYFSEKQTTVIKSLTVPCQLQGKLTLIVEPTFVVKILTEEASCKLDAPFSVEILTKQETGN